MIPPLLVGAGSWRVAAGLPAFLAVAADLRPRFAVPAFGAGFPCAWPAGFAGGLAVPAGGCPGGFVAPVAGFAAGVAGFEGAAAGACPAGLAAGAAGLGAGAAFFVGVCPDG